MKIMISTQKLQFNVQPFQNLLGSCPVIWLSCWNTVLSGFVKELRGGLVWIILAIPCGLFLPVSYTFPVLLRHVSDLWDLAGD